MAAGREEGEAFRLMKEDGLENNVAARNAERKAAEENRHSPELRADTVNIPLPPVVAAQNDDPSAPLLENAGARLRSARLRGTCCAVFALGALVGIAYMAAGFIEQHELCAASNAAAVVVCTVGKLCEPFRGLTADSASCTAGERLVSAQLEISVSDPDALSTVSYCGKTHLFGNALKQSYSCERDTESGNKVEREEGIGWLQAADIRSNKPNTNATVVATLSHSLPPAAPSARALGELEGSTPGSGSAGNTQDFSVSTQIQFVNETAQLGDVEIPDVHSGSVASSVANAVTGWFKSWKSNPMSVDQGKSAEKHS